MKKMTIAGLLVLPLAYVMFILGTRLGSLALLLSLPILFCLPWIAIASLVLNIISLFREKRSDRRIIVGVAVLVSILVAAWAFVLHADQFPKVNTFLAPPVTVQLNVPDGGEPVSLDVAILRHTSLDGSVCYVMLGGSGVLKYMAEKGLKRDDEVLGPPQGNRCLSIPLPYNLQFDVAGLRPSTITAQGTSVLIALVNGDHGRIDLVNKIVRDRLVAALAGERTYGDLNAANNLAWLFPALHWSIQSGLPCANDNYAKMWGVPQAVSARENEPARNPDREYRIYASLTDIVRATAVPAKRVVLVPKDFPTIQQALDTADSGTVVLVAPGDYFGDVALKAGVTLAAYQPDSVTLRGNVTFAHDTTLLNLTFADAQIGPPDSTKAENLPHGVSAHPHRNVAGPAEPPLPVPIDRMPRLPGVAAESAAPTPKTNHVRILYCRFRGTHCEGDNWLLRMSNAEDITIAGCVFSYSGKWRSGELYGLHLQDCRNIVVHGNVFADLYKTESGNVAGVVLERCSGTFAANLVTDIDKRMWNSAYGIWVRQPHDLVVRHNMVSNISSTDWGSAFGIALEGDGQAQVLGNLVLNIKGKGWDAPVYGIYSETNIPTIVDNDVSNLIVTMQGQLAKKSRPFTNAGGAENWTLSPTFVEGTCRLNGPPGLLQNGRDLVGVYAEAPLTLELPDCVLVPKAAAAKQEDATPAVHQ